MRWRQSMVILCPYGCDDYACLVMQTENAWFHQPLVTSVSSEKKVKWKTSTLEEVIYCWHPDLHIKIWQFLCGQKQTRQQGQMDTFTSPTFSMQKFTSILKSQSNMTMCLPFFVAIVSLHLDKKIWNWTATVHVGGEWVWLHLTILPVSRHLL